MRVKPAWFRRAMMQYVAPELPGSWAASGWIVYKQPVGWLLCGLFCDVGNLAPPKFGLQAFVQMLPCPASGIDLSLARPVPRGMLWEAPETVDASESQMGEIGGYVQREALPFFGEFGTTGGHLSWLEQQITEFIQRSGRSWGDLYVDEQLMYIHLLRGDVDEALRAAHWADMAFEATDRPWAEEVHNRVRTVAAAAERDIDEALQILREQANETCRQLKLPAIEVD